MQANSSALRVTRTKIQEVSKNSDVEFPVHSNRPGLI